MACSPLEPDQSLELSLEGLGLLAPEPARVGEEVEDQGLAALTEAVLLLDAGETLDGLEVGLGSRVDASRLLPPSLGDLVTDLVERPLGGGDLAGHWDPFLGAGAPSIYYNKICLRFIPQAEAAALTHSSASWERNIPA